MDWKNGSGVHFEGLYKIPDPYLEKMKKYLLFAFLLQVVFAFAQDRRTIYGQITDLSDAPVAYCTVSLRRCCDSLVVTGDVSDKKGRYRLENVPCGDYFLEFAHLSFETLTRRADREQCSVKLRPLQIGEIVVLPRYIRYEAGRYVVSMSGNPLAREQFLSDALQLLPGVRREDSSFKINGHQIKSISINGRSVRVEEVETLAASSVKTIEIRQNATAGKEVSERGAKLLITLKPLSASGLRGQVVSSVVVRENGFGGAGLSVPFGIRRGRFNVYNNLTYRYFDKVDKAYRIKKYTKETPFLIQSTERTRTHHHIFSDALNVVCDLSPRHQIGLIGKIGYVAGTPDELTRSRYLKRNVESGTYHSRGNLDNVMWQVVTDYSYRLDDRGSVLTAEVDYMDTSIEKSYCYVDQMDACPVAECTRERMTPRTLSVETEVAVSKIFSKTLTVNGGISTHHHDVMKNSLLTPPDAPAKQSLFRYRGNGMAAYAECRARMGRLSLSGGMRLQWNRITHFTAGDTRWHKRDYVRLCPDFAATFLLDEVRSTSIGVFCLRNDGAIPYGDLSPIRVRVDEFHYAKGNPDLAPAKGFDLGATCTLCGRWTLAYTFSRTVDGIQHLTFVDGEDSEQTFRQPINCVASSVHKLDLSCAMRLASWWRINWEVAGVGEYWHYYRRRLGTNSLRVSLYNTFYFGRLCGVHLCFTASTPRHQLERRHNGTYSLDGEIFKTAAHNRLYLSLSCRGLIRHNEQIRTWNREHTFTDFTYRRTFFGIEFRISYKFNNHVPCCLSPTGTPRKPCVEYK